MNVAEARIWVSDAGDTIKFDRCVGQDEHDEVDSEVEDILGILDKTVQLEAALKNATWDLAVYTFEGKNTSLGEEADRLFNEYLSKFDWNEKINTKE